MEEERGAAARQARALLAPDPVLGVPIPAYGGRSLPNISASAVAAVGQEPRRGTPLLPPLAADVDPFGRRRAEGPVVLFLVDGMGWFPPASRAGFASNALPLDWRRRMRPVTSVFPTTTAVALTSLSTAEPPSRHGVVGHRMYLPAFGAVVEMLRMSPVGVAAGEALVGREWTPAAVSGVPNLFERGVAATVVSRDRFEGSGFTRLLYEGAEYVGYSTAADLAHRLTEVLDRVRPPPLVLAYWDELDTVCHLRGPRPEFASFEAAQVARILRATARALPAHVARRTTVLLTSDHGHVPQTRSRELAIDQEPRISAQLHHPPGGDRRAAFFSARPGALPQLEQALSERLPPRHRVIPARTAIERGLFGPPPFHSELAARVGDLIAFVRSPAGLTYRVPGAPARARSSQSGHGGLEPEELLVPLVSGLLSDLRKLGGNDG